MKADRIVTIACTVICAMLLNHGIQFRCDCDDIIVRNLRIRVLRGDSR